MKLLIKISVLLLFSSNVVGQQVQMLLQGAESDSSFYHVEKINDNEFWLGGEYGILKKIDSLGNVSSLNFPNAGLDILKIEKIQNYVFIITANATIYRYDLAKNTFLTKRFPELKNKCFYDLIALKNGELLVCGGTSGIVKGKRKIPRGFIATIDKNLEEINVVWKKKSKFVWSLLETEDKNILAVTFNGLNTKIRKTEDLSLWKKEIKIRGLVHEISFIDNQLWYCGSKNTHFKKNGIIGQTTKKRKILKQTGCLWSLDSLDEKIIAVTQSGELLSVDKKNNEIEHLTIPRTFTIYDIEKISDSKLLVVGHGKTAYIIDFKS